MLGVATTIGNRATHPRKSALPAAPLVVLPRLTADYLKDNYNINGAELVYTNANAYRLMGWNNLHRLPRADEIAIKMGSVFLLGFQQPLDALLCQALFNLYQQGIGLRRTEGFGQLRVAHPFHWEVNNV